MTTPVRAMPIVAAVLLVGSVGAGGTAAAHEAPPERPACSQPDLPDRTLQSNELNGILQRSQTYIECMQKAIEAERAKATTMLDAARAQAEKSNRMVEEVNEFVRKAKDYQAEHQGS